VIKLDKFAMVPISEDNTHESYVYYCPIRKCAVKMYWNMTKEQLSRYAGLQNQLSTVWYKIPIECGEVEFQNNPVNEIVISILEIPLISSECTYIWAGPNKQYPVRITEPEYVSGSTLFDLHEEFEGWDKVVLQKIRQVAHGVLLHICSEAWIGFDKKLIGEWNMKLVSHHDWVIYLVITDIAADIETLLSLN